MLLGLSSPALGEVTEADLAADDECLASDEDAGRCALSALQLRGLKLGGEEAAKEASHTQEAGLGSAAEAAVAEEGSGVGDEALRLKAMGRAEVREAPRFVNVSLAEELEAGGAVPGGRCLGSTRSDWTLDWTARGGSFFNDWTFMTVDETHGAAEYASKDAALREGLATFAGGRAIIRTAKSATPYKRKSVNIHTNGAWDPANGFLSILKYKHLPSGCGVWPGFWAMNSDRVWPAGGELDILEYANTEPSKVSFHVEKGCRLDQRQLGSCMNGAGVGSPGPMDCATSYFQNLFGCRPQQKQYTGEWFSNNPGVLATEWTPSHIKVFHIPNGQIPADLESDSPQPGSWDKFLIAYLPFVGSCNVGPQELVLNIQFCGDWAGNAWERSGCPARTGISSSRRMCSNDIFNPAEDCCTKFVNSAAAESTMQRAYFDIEYVKVFTGGAPRRLSGTYMRGGVPLMR